MSANANPATSARRIIGIDPGLNRTGYGVIDASGSRLVWVEHGVIRIPPADLPSRLLHILRSLCEVIRALKPTEAAVEKVFVNVNPQSTLLLGQARGAAICAAVDSGVSVAEYTALQIKKAASGYGHAEKMQIQKMVQRLLALKQAPPSDAADALACAICHAHMSAPGGVCLPIASRGTGRQRSRAAWSEAVDQRKIGAGNGPSARAGAGK